MNTISVRLYLPGQEIELAKVEDVEALITDYKDPDKIPCWAEIWPAARGLARVLWSQSGWNGKKVLDLGSGLGLPGVAAGLRGAEVVFSDFKAHALELAAWNARKNGVENYRVHQGDWRSFHIGEKFHCILASDILYDPKLNFYLEDIFLDTLLPGGVLYVAHPGREDTVHFLSKIRNSGLWEEEIETVGVKIEEEVLPYYSISVHILRFAGRGKE